MISRWRWVLKQLSGRLWLRATLFAVIGVVTALVGVVAEFFVPATIPDMVGSDAVGTVLNVIATSMLAVTTISLGDMVSAYGAATRDVTPRATRLLMQDSTSQNVLSTFIGSFLFSLVGIVTLTIEGYGERGRLVLFLVTIGVIIIIVASLLRWIDYLSRLGRVTETTERVEEAARRALQARSEQPNLGGRPAGDLPEGAEFVLSRKTGYVQHVDTAALNDWAEGEGLTVHLMVLPGSFVHHGTRLAGIVRSPESEIGDQHPDEAVWQAISIDGERTFDQDPRFGIIVLAEVASRALSPAVNDSGTAIDVIGRQVRLLETWAERGPAEEVACPLVFVPSLSDDDLLEDAFAMIARDGAGHLEVGLRLQKALCALADIGGDGFRSAARRQAARALVHTESNLDEWEFQRVQGAACLPDDRKVPAQ